MLILPPGHAQAVRNPRTMRGREKWIVGGLVGAVAALIVVVVIAVASTGRHSGHGCVDVTIPYSIGGQEFYRCGAAARAMCGQVGVPGGYSGGVGQAVALQCRKAGLQVG
jgi:hypothetical protein